MCEYEKGREKAYIIFFYFHTSRQLASNISLLLYSLFFFTSFVLAMSFFYYYYYYEYRSVRAVRDQRWGLRLFSLRFLAWCIRLSFLIYTLSPSWT